MVNQSPVAKSATPEPHRFEARVLQHRHVVGQIIVCGACGLVAHECRAVGAA